MDWAGVATFSTALFLLVLALVRGNDEGWGSTMIVSLFAGAAALMAAFVAIESQVKEPMLPLGLFKLPSFTGVQLAAFAVSGSMFALFLYLTLYLQNYLGLSPLEAGLHDISRSPSRRSSSRRSPARFSLSSPARDDERRARRHRCRAAADVRHRRRRRVDHAARRLPGRRSGISGCSTR